MKELLSGANTLDIIIGVFFFIELIWMLYYLLWQFAGTSMSEETMTKIIRFLDIMEWGIFVVTRFLPYNKIGKSALGAFYVASFILLILQFVLAEWGSFSRFKTFLWMCYYVILFLIDIIKIDVFGELAMRFGPTFVSIDHYLKGSWLGVVLQAIIVAMLKEIILQTKRNRY